mgnify:CR=1 FL=1
MNQRECERLGPALSAHAAGEPETAELGEHLTGCAACRAEHAALAGLFGDLRGLPTELLAAPVEQRAAASIRVSAPQSRAARWPLLALLPAALLFLWIGGAGHRTPPKTPDAPAPATVASPAQSPAAVGVATDAAELEDDEEAGLFRDDAPEPGDLNELLGELDHEALTRVALALRQGA